jgi:hypothetical protein
VIVTLVALLLADVVWLFGFGSDINLPAADGGSLGVVSETDGIGADTSWLVLGGVCNDDAGDD